MIRWKFWTIIVIIFITGCLLGSAGTALYIRHVVSGIVRGDSQALTGLITGKLSRRLDLTGQQQIQAEEIVRSGQEEWMEVRRQFAPRVMDIVRKTVEELKMMLSPDQGEELDRLVGEAQERWLIPGETGMKPER
jgi:hypothetical protein